MNTITGHSAAATITGWTFAMIVVIIGILNLMLVHPVPGIIYLLFSLLYFPPVTKAIYQKTGLSLPTAVKIILGLVILWFTLGISDLGDMMDKL